MASSSRTTCPPSITPSSPRQARLRSPVGSSGPPAASDAGRRLPPRSNRASGFSSTRAASADTRSSAASRAPARAMRWDRARAAACPDELADRRPRPQLRFCAAEHGPGRRRGADRGPYRRAAGDIVVRRGEATEGNGCTFASRTATPTSRRLFCGSIRFVIETSTAFWSTFSKAASRAQTPVRDVAHRLLHSSDGRQQALGARLRNLGIHRWQIWSSGAADSIRTSSARAGLAFSSSTRLLGDVARRRLRRERPCCTVATPRRARAHAPGHRRGAQRLPPRAGRRDHRPRRGARGQDRGRRTQVRALHARVHAAPAARQRARRLPMRQPRAHADGLTRRSRIHHRDASFVPEPLVEYGHVPTG